jgi:hypothetical protein
MFSKKKGKFVAIRPYFLLAAFDNYLTNCRYCLSKSLPFINHTHAETEPSEEYCSTLLDKNTEIPEACKKYASIKAKLEAKVTDPFAGMSGGRSQVRNAQIKRRMSTRHGQGKEGKKSSWFG